MSREDEQYRCGCHRCARGRQVSQEWVLSAVIALVVGVAAAFLWLAFT